MDARLQLQLEELIAAVACRGAGLRPDGVRAVSRQRAIAPRVKAGLAVR